MDINSSAVDLLSQMIRLDDEDSARKAFGLFCAKYSATLLKHAGAICVKWNMSCADGEHAVDLTFERILKLHSFDPAKSKAKDLDTGVEIWLIRILHNILYDIKTNRLSNSSRTKRSYKVIKNVTEYYDEIKKGDENEDERLKKAVKILDKRMQGLSENMRIILLTYLAYEEDGRYLPRNLTAQLQKVTGLSQSTIKVYKGRAMRYIKNK